MFDPTAAMPTSFFALFFLYSPFALLLLMAMGQPRLVIIWCVGTIIFVIYTLMNRPHVSEFALIGAVFAAGHLMAVSACAFFGALYLKEKRVQNAHQERGAS